MADTNIKHVEYDQDPKIHSQDIIPRGVKNPNVDSISPDKIITGSISATTTIDVGPGSSGGYVRLDGTNNRIIINDGISNRIVLGNI